MCASLIPQAWELVVNPTTNQLTPQAQSAYRIARKLAYLAAPGDPESAAHEALVLAVRDYDPARGVPFASFFAWKFRGAARAEQRRAGRFVPLAAAVVPTTDDEAAGPWRTEAEQAVLDEFEDYKRRHPKFDERAAAGLFIRRKKGLPVGRPRKEVVTV